MLEKSRRRLFVAILILLAGGVFIPGINWGLPSHAIDPILFGSGLDSATRSLHAYTLSGVGITKLAGNWTDHADLPADVSAHPITDRSKPLTLLKNEHGLSEEQLLKQGDPALAALSARADAADQMLSKLQTAGASDDVIDQARQRALAARQKVHDYVETLNRNRFPDLSASAGADDVARAQILRRYRLYSDQPDEMISLRALADMHPARLEFDPKLYQYGGLWLYPLGAIIRGASAAGYVTVSRDPTLYLDSPEDFARFYILARAYSALWGIVGALAVFAILRRCGASPALSLLAGVCFICLPAVVDLAHEAKPHLASTSLIMLAVLAASHYVETGKKRWIAWTAIASGAAASMVLSGLVSLSILPVMSLARRDRAARFAAVCVGGLLVAGAIYFAANPYVAIHLAGDSAILKENLANSRAMYPIAVNPLRALKLILIGASWPIALAGAFAAFFLIVARKKSGFGIGWLLGIPAILVLIEFVLHAGNKPGEYARFGLPVDAALATLAFIGVARLIHGRGAQIAIGVLLIAAAATYSFSYEQGFLDARSRTEAAAEIDARLAQMPAPVLYVRAEPAPYCLPPVNLFRWKIILLPSDGLLPRSSPRGVLVEPRTEICIFDPAKSPMSWADPGFIVADIPRN